MEKCMGRREAGGAGPACARAKHLGPYCICYIDYNSTHRTQPGHWPRIRMIDAVPMHPMQPAGARDLRAREGNEGRESVHRGSCPVTRATHSIRAGDILGDAQRG